MRLVWIPLMLAANVASAQQAASQDRAPFVEYDSRIAPYLQRIHGRPGPLSWRADYPGGISAWRKQARSKHRELLGLDRIAAEAREHQATVTLGKEVQEEGYTRRLGKMETEPGVVVPFWVLVPKGGPQQRPLAICAHGHDTDGWNTYAGVYRDAKHQAATLAKDGDVGVQAVKRGFTTIVPATRGLAAAVSMPDPKGRHGSRQCRAQLIHCLLTGRTPVGERVWDTQRLLDWALETLNVDPQKVVLVGNSGGGVLTVHAAAQDERIAVAVPSCSFTSFTSSTGFVFHCDCCLIPRAQTELGDMSDIGALAAPRALLAVHGRQDGLHHDEDVEAAMERVQAVYDAMDAKEQFAIQWGDDGHKFYPQLMWPFIMDRLNRAAGSQTP